MLKTRTFETSFDNSKYIEEFMREYSIKHDVEILAGRIRYKAKMFERQFNAFSTYIHDLGQMGVYPIML